jgi:hypothetical protein
MSSPANFDGFVTDLDQYKPTRSDPVAEGADAIREIKSALKKTFPYANSPLQISNDAIETAVKTTLVEQGGLISGLQSELTALIKRVEALENS